MPKSFARAKSFDTQLSCYSGRTGIEKRALPVTHPFNIGADRFQLFFKPFIAAVEVIDPVDHALTLGGQRADSGMVRHGAERAELTAQSQKHPIHS